MRVAPTHHVRTAVESCTVHVQHMYPTLTEWTNEATATKGELPTCIYLVIGCSIRRSNRTRADRSRSTRGESRTHARAAQGETCFVAPLRRIGLTARVEKVAEGARWRHGCC